VCTTSILPGLSGVERRFLRAFASPAGVVRRPDPSRGHIRQQGTDNRARSTGLVAIAITSRLCGASKAHLRIEAGDGVKNGAARGTRTPDPVITNDVLYQLSYCGEPFGNGLIIRAT
jgi:hypothetical protein